MSDIAVLIPPDIEQDLRPHLQLPPQVQPLASLGTSKSQPPSPANTPPVPRTTLHLNTGSLTKKGRYLLQILMFLFEISPHRRP
jgi:hypothetical protein